jgi:hypothetical protein
MIWRELCRQALQISNLAPRGQDADPQLNADALIALSSVLSEWSRDGILPPAFDTINANMIGGQAIYTMGPSGDFDRRPLDLTQAILSGSTLGTTRFPILIEPWDNYQALTFPSGVGIPGWCFLNLTFPLAQLAVYPTPNSNWNLKLIGTFAWDVIDPNATVSLPPGYDTAILDATAVKVCENYTRVVPAWLYNRARDGRSSIVQLIPPKDQVKDNAMAWGNGRRNIRNWETDSPR